MSEQRQTNAVQKTQSNLPAPIITQLQSVMGNITSLLPPDIPLQQFRAALWLELRQQYGIQECGGESVAAAVVKAATYGLLPGRDCRIIPFRNRGRKEATMVTKYQGLILSLERTGKVKKAFAHMVYSKDHFEVDYLTDVFSHKPVLMGDRGKPQCVYGCILETNGTRHFEVMTLAQVDAIKQRAPSHDSGPWITDYEEMARKTALKRVAKYCQLSPKQQQMLDDDDDREQTDIGEDRFRETSADLYGEPRDVPNFGKPTAAATDWRTELAQVAIHLPENEETAELHGNIGQALVMKNTPEDIGLSILADAKAYLDNMTTVTVGK